ncbi:MAG: hypothetical protein IJR70_06095 [Eubacterium sp.]|nr:hypothetical protein [Eubacterium sp.]
MFDVICKDCGTGYTSKVNKNGLCEVCRARHIAETKRNYYINKRKEHNKAVKDTLTYCEKCGKLIAPKSGTSGGLCETCQLLKEQKYKTKNTIRYRKEHYDCIQFKVAKGERDKLRKYAEERGMNLAEFVRTSMEFYMETHK